MSGGTVIHSQTSRRGDKQIKTFKAAKAVTKTKRILKVKDVAANEMKTLEKNERCSI